MDPLVGYIASASAALPRAGYTSGSAAMTGPLAFTGSQTTAGNGIVNIFRDLSGNIIYNVSSGGYHRKTSNGTSIIDFSASLVNLYLPIGFTSIASRYTLGAGQIYGSSQNVTVEATSAGCASIGANIFTTGSNPSLSVYGLSNSSYAGAVENKAGAVTRASNGTWTAVYSLAKGAYHGDFYVFDSLGDGHARIPISSTTLGTVVDNASGVTYVDAGSVGASNVAFRVNSGNLEINVGTSITASTRFAIYFEGTVI